MLKQFYYQNELYTIQKIQNYLKHMKEVKY